MSSKTPATVSLNVKSLTRSSWLRKTSSIGSFVAMLNLVPLSGRRPRLDRRPPTSVAHRARPMHPNGRSSDCLAEWTCEAGRREWDRTTDPHHVKVVLYH